MQKLKKKKHAQKTTIALLKAAQHLAVHTERYFPSSLCLEPSAPFSVALRLAHIETQAQIALQQLTALAAVTFAQVRNSRLIATLSPQRAVLTLLSRPTSAGLNVNTNQKYFRATGTHITAAMYHHQGAPPFPGGPRPPPNQQQGRPADMMPPVGGFQFPRPTQLPDELESALSIRGTRDMDHRLIEHLNRLKQHQNQAAPSGISQHGSYSSALHETPQGVDWSSYEPPNKLFAGHPPSSAHQGPHQSGHAGTSLPNWNPPVNETSAPNQRVEGGRGLYTPESAGTILASFGLSNEDLEALSHYPDDQLTPDTLPFILRDMQIHKTVKQKTHSSPVPHSRSPEVPSLLTVTQTEGRVIDYGHASQAKEESGPRETFKKEPLSTERTVKMYPTPPAPKLDTSERRQVRLEPAESIKHGDRDYRRRSSEHHTSRSPPPRDFTSPKPRHQDRDYRQERPKPRASAEKRSEERSVPKQHTSSASKPHSGGSKKLPTPTMISDFSGVAPKIYPHTCSLCEMQCEQEKDWIDHLGTVNHTAACRHLRTKYPDWKPNLASRDKYGGHSADHKRHPEGHSASRSASWSPSPPSGKHRVAYRPRGKPYAPHHPVPRHHHYRDVDDRYERPHPRGGSHLHRPARDHWERRESAEGSSRPYMKRPYFDSSRRFTGSKGEYVSKRSALTKPKPSIKPGNGTTKQSDESPPAKKKKKVAPPVVVAGPGPDCLVYLTDIPKDATEQEVINLAGSFGPINNVILMPSSEEDSEKDHGLQASVCMMKPEDAQTFANSPNLVIRDQVITALVAKKPEEEQPSGENSTTKEEEKDSGGAEEQKSDQKPVVLIEGLPESGWSEEDIIKLAEPFGCPSDIIVAKQIGKVLLSLPDLETALEMVKVHSFSPPTITEHKLKITRVKRKSPVTIDKPTALYNLLTVPTEGTPRKYIGWSMLIVVTNIPPTLSSASVVHKLVSRIGTVCKTLVVNNMVICEMATGLLAAAVHRHYSKFPCIIQNNPLVFSRKPDPKPAAKVVPGLLDTNKSAHENKKDATASEPAADQNESTIHKEEPQEEKVKEVEVKSEPAEQEQESQEAVGENIGNEAIEPKEEEEEEMVASDAKTEADIQTETENQLTNNEVVMETAKDNQTSDTSLIENGADVPPAETETTVTEGEAMTEDANDKTAVPKSVSAERETQAKPTKTAAPEQKRTSLERSKDPVKNNSSSSREEERRRLDRERKERDRERRERDRIRKEREYEERARRDRDRRGDPRREDPRREEPRRDRDRRDRDRKEWERRDSRKRSYGDTDWRSDSSKRMHYRDDRYKSSTERSQVDDEDFPFNLSDFVTVDEVGDVDPSEVPNPDLDVSMETIEGGQESSEPPQLEARVISMEVSTEPEVKTDEEGVLVVKEEAEEQEKAGEDKEADSAAADIQCIEEKSVEEVGDMSELPTPIPPAAPVETIETVQETSDPTQQDTAEVSATTEKEEEEILEAKEEVKEEEKQQTDSTSSAPDAEIEKSENAKEDTTESTETDSLEFSLPPFNPNNPVGMDFLVPMTGFFCKVCSRFFTGSKDTEINHSKTLKHYENLERFLKTRNTETSASAASSS